MDHAGGQRQPRRGLRRRCPIRGTSRCRGSATIQGAYPHTLRFDSHGQIWMTLTKSNHIALLRPADRDVRRTIACPRPIPAEVGPLDPGRLRLRRRARRHGLVVAALRRAHRTLRSRHQHGEGVEVPRSTDRGGSRADQRRHRLGAGLRLGRARPLRSDDRALEGLSHADRDRRAAGLRHLRDCRTTSTRTVRPGTCGSTARTPTR